MILILKFLLIHVRLGTSLKKQKLRVSQEYCQIQLVSQVEVEYLKDLHLDYQWFQYYKWQKKKQSQQNQNQQHNIQTKGKKRSAIKEDSKLKKTQQRQKSKTKIQIFQEYESKGQEVIPVFDTAGIAKANFFPNRFSNYGDLGGQENNSGDERMGNKYFREN